MTKKTLLEKYDDLTDDNHHNEAAMILVKNFGTKDEVETLKRIKARHLKNGFMLPSDMDTRYEFTKKYYEELLA